VQLAVEKCIEMHALVQLAFQVACMQCIQVACMQCIQVALVQQQQVHASRCTACMHACNYASENV